MCVQPRLCCSAFSHKAARWSHSWLCAAERRSSDQDVSDVGDVNPCHNRLFALLECIPFNGEARLDFGRTKALGATA